jgi:hypothetical protein
LCRDECFALGLVAGCQHGDAETRDMCITALTGCAEARIGAVADAFAATLTALDQLLRPVPRHVIEDIAARPLPGQYH